ncbi:hypothetical protein [uncultured Desulfobacter sp.]|uniref:hypothetical protein n=1 Tax=uncultured Desulfobacter sp. TaxID=240139 RepID=UPI0029F4F96F|nr:hypothetical protein [uncultured Desulfobacter sp.]
MNKFIFFLIITAFFPIASHGDSLPSLDQFGGYTNLKIAEKSTVWSTAKIKNRWFLVTPEGNAFINLGVYTLGEGAGADTNHKTYFDYWREKYTWNAEIFCNVQLKRLRTWGFNSISDYAYAHCKGFDPKVGSKTIFRTPSFPFPINGAEYSRRNVGELIPGHVKEIIRPCNNNFKFWGAKVVDYFDPRFAQYIEARIKTYRRVVNSPWCIGVSYDEGDNLYGFGAGDDWGGVTNDHLGLVVLVTPPIQTISPDKKWKYQDTETYIKTALKNFLKMRYKTIEKLNAAWNSNYTSFDSNGGWEKGTGLLDEDGRRSHKYWIGRDKTLSDGSASPALKKDLDDFLYIIADKYFGTYHKIIKEQYPDILQTGPTVFGSWGQPPRRQVLQAAGKYLDVVRTNLSEPDLQKKIDFMVTHLGHEIPMIQWLGVVANNDSALYAYGDAASKSRTQEERGQKYEKQLFETLMTKSNDGSYLFTGIQLWAWTDHWGEKTNWGLVTIKDNAYDGDEAVKKKKMGRDGFLVGGEDRDYGDFITPVTKANCKVYKWINERK